MSVKVLLQSQSYNEDLLQLLKVTATSLESLAEEFFQICATTSIPCVHCLKKKSSVVHMFDLTYCEQAAADGRSYVVCGEFPVALSALCPDLVVSAELPVIKLEALLNQTKIGEGFFF